MKHVWKMTAAAMCLLGGVCFADPAVAAVHEEPTAAGAVETQTLADELFPVREANRTSVQDGSEVILYTQQSTLHLDEVSAKKQPQYEAALTYYSKRLLMEGERAKKVLDSELERRDYEAEEKQREAKRKKKDDIEITPEETSEPEEPQLRLCDIREIFLRRADAKAMSILVTHNYNHGGDHGNFTVQGYTHRPSGQSVSWRELFADPDALPEVLEKKLRAKYTGVSFFDLYGALNDMAKRESFIWTLDADGITFYFAPYVLASYSEGMLTTFVSWRSEPELFSAEWRKTDEAYAVELPVGRVFPVDLNGDGGEEELEVTGGMGEVFAVSYAGVSVSYPEEVTEVLATRLHTRDGRDYVYVDGLRPDGRRGLFVWALTADGPEFIGISNLTLEMKEALGRRRTWQVLHNPENFILWDDNTASLVHCRANDKGMPEIE